MDEKSWNVDKLTSQNYPTWKFKLKHLLIAKELFGYVDGSVTLANDADAPVKAEFEKKTSKALAHVVLAVSDNLLYLITECETPKAAWDKLKAHFERDTLANKLFLKKKYFRTVMNEGSSVEDHLRHMKAITDKLAAINAAISEEDQVVTLLGSLPESYGTVVTALEARGDDLRLEFVSQTLLNEEQKREKTPPASVGAVESTKSLVQSDTALSVDNYNADHRPIRVCYICSSPNHLQRFCPNNNYDNRGRGYSARGRGRGRQSNHQPHDAKLTVHDDVESAFISSEINPEAQQWLIDSGATSHMATSKASFCEYTHLDKPESVVIADGSKVNAIGKGNVQLRVRVSANKYRLSTLYNVLHIPELNGNLFSVKAVTQRGYIVQFGHSRCWVKNSRRMVCALGTMVNKLYHLDIQSIDHTAASAVAMNVLWHQRLAHVNTASIKNMTQWCKNGCDISDDIGVCEPCVKGKMSRQPYKSRDSIKSKRVLELVHTDVCGPMQTESLGGSKYFVSFIDDFSRTVHVFFLRDKCSVFQVFKEYELLVTNETGQTIGTLRSDGGGEYMSLEFESYLSSRGIQHQVTARHSPQQNGVAERYNRTVCEAARALIVQSDLPKTFWAEAISTAVYVRNRVPTRAFQQLTTPYETWTNTKPDIGNLRVFGCLAYAHIPDQLRRKLDEKAESMIFVGYSLKSKAYRLYDPVSRKIVVRRDVVFDENKVGVLSSVDTSSSLNSESLSVNSKAPEPTNSPTVSARPTRSTQPIVRFGIDEYKDLGHSASVAAANIVEPLTLSEVECSPNRDDWIAAVQCEYDALAHNDTWELVDLPPDRKPIGCKWVFKTKYTSSGAIDKFKARLVAKGYAQKYGIDYDETYAPVVHRSSLRVLLSDAVERGMIIHQMDVQTAFLNGILSEEIFMTQPDGFIEPGKEKLVCKLKRSLYGLKQSPKCWNTVLDEHLKSQGFIQSSADSCVYVRWRGSEKMMIAVYVDDLIIMSDSDIQLNEMKDALCSRFKMSDLGPLHHCLGIVIERTENSLKLNQKPYIQQLLRKYNMESCCPVSTPAASDAKLIKDDGSKSVDQNLYQSIVGSLLYAAVSTRPDIAEAVGVLCKFNSCPTEIHMTAAKRVLRYLKGTMDLGLVFAKVGEPMVGYTDADYANDDDRHSKSGVVFINAGSPISWSSKRQSVIALSTAESEYIALFEGVVEGVWLHQLLSDIGSKLSDAMTICVDNQSAIAIANNNKTSKRTKHIDVKYHYIREAIDNEKVRTQFCPSAENIADIFTKPLPREKFVTLRAMLGMR